MPTSASQVLNLASIVPYADAYEARGLAVKIGPSLTLARGTILGELAASPGVYVPYNANNTDGSQTAKGILIYDITTDASGNITLTGLTAQFGPSVPTVASVGMWYSGTFNLTDLIGLDANAVSQLRAHLVQGSLGASGILRIG